MRPIRLLSIACALLTTITLLASPTALLAAACVPRVRANPPAAEEALARYQPTVRGVSRDMSVPADLIARVIWVESRGDRHAVSSSGALGLTQVIELHWLPGEDWTDPYQNIRKGAGILRANYERSGDWVIATRAYAGAGPVAEEYVHLVFEFDCGGDALLSELE